MVGHQQVRISDFTIDTNRLHEIDVTLVRINFLKVVPVAPDVPEVHVEDLLPRTEIPDHIINLAAGICEHLRHCSLAEVQTMIRAFADRDEALQPVDSSEHSVDTLIPLGRDP